MRRLQAIKLDGDAERVRRDHHEAITEIQGLPGVGVKVIADVDLADGVETPIAHGLGRKPLWTKESALRGPLTAGYVEEVRSGSHDRSRVVVYKASGYGATVTVDVLVL